MDPDLQRAIEHIRDQKSEEARAILLEILHEDYDNAQAWFWLAHCAEDDEEHARALREVLRLEPENTEARRLALKVTRQTASGWSVTANKQPVLEKTNLTRYRNLFFNLLVFLIIAGIALGIAFAWLNFQQDESSPENTGQAATLDAETVCTTLVNDTVLRLPARCSAASSSTICIASNGVVTGPASNELRVPGDRVPLDNFTLIETLNFDAAQREWGLIQIRTPKNVLLFITGSVRISNIEDNLQKFNFFNTNPSPAACNQIAPDGILIRSNPGTPASFSINGADITLDGTAFFQLDVAAGLRIAVLRGVLEIKTITQTETVLAGQVVNRNVDSTRLILDEAGELLTDTSRIRGNLQQLIPFGTALELPVEQWAFPGETPRVTLTPEPSPTATPSPTAIPPTATAPPFVPTVTLESGVQGSDATLAPADTTLPDGSPPVNRRLSGIWQCTVSEDFGLVEYTLNFDTNPDKLPLIVQATLPDFTITLAGKALPARPTELFWETLPGYNLPVTTGWLEFREITLQSNRLTPQPPYIFRLLINNNGRISGGVFVQTPGDNETIIGFITACTQQSP